MADTVCYIADPEYVFREVAGSFIPVPTGNAAADRGGIVDLNEIRAFLRRQLAEVKTGEQLISALAEEFEAAAEQCAEDTDAFGGTYRARIY